MIRKQLPSVSEALVNQCALSAIAHEYEKQAQAYRVIAKAMHEARMPEFENYDKRALDLTTKANDVRRFINAYA